MRSILLTLRLIGLILLVAFAAVGQEKNDLSVAQLKEQILKMESIDLDSNTPSELKSINREFLNKRREQLRSLLTRTIAALRKYQSSIGPSLTADEHKALENSIALLETDLKGEQDLATGKEQESSLSVSQSGLGPGGDGTPFTAATNSTSDNSSVPTQLSRSFGSIPAAAMTAQPSNCYSDAPDLIVTNLDRAAQDIVNKGRISPLSAYFPDIFFYTVADAVSSDQANLRKLKAYQYMGETARTDKQVGASARSGGSTSAVEKPGFASLLGFAVENGAIQQQTNATSLTLSTSPYALVAASQGDSADTYQKYDFLNRIGISANFNLANQTNVLANASRKQLNEWSVRFRVFGDRSTRGADFRNFWDNNVRGKVQRRLVAITHADRVIDSDPALRTLSATVETQLDATVQSILANTAAAGQTAAIKNAVLCGLQQSVFNQVRPGGSVAISAATKSVIDSDLVPGLLMAHEDLEQARAELNNFFAQQESKPEMTLAYSNLHPATGGNYSVLGGLYERKSFAPVKLIANGGFSIYNKPDPKMNQRSIRDMAFALSFEGKAQSPFLTNQEDLSKITFSFTGRYQRMFENIHQPNKKADIAVAQFKLEIPVLTGMSVPLSVTFANATELIKEKHVRANFGFTFDADKIFALAKLKKL
jgi:hypothetical protein